MARKKKETEASPKNDHFTYCNSKSDHCNRTDCARNYANAPWDEIFWMARWIPEKDGSCEGYVNRNFLK